MRVKFLPDPTSDMLLTGAAWALHGLEDRGPLNNREQQQIYKGLPQLCRLNLAHLTGVSTLLCN